MKIPVFHDDQHGTAIVVGAAAINALRVAGKTIEDIKIVSTGGGAAGIACLNMLMKLGAQAREHLALRHRTGWSTRAATTTWARRRRPSRRRPSCARSPT